MSGRRTIRPLSGRVPCYPSRLHRLFPPPCSLSDRLPIHYCSLGDSHQIRQDLHPSPSKERSRLVRSCSQLLAVKPWVSRKEDSIQCKRAQFCSSGLLGEPRPTRRLRDHGRVKDSTPLCRLQCQLAIISLFHLLRRHHLLLGSPILRLQISPIWSLPHT